MFFQATFPSWPAGKLHTYCRLHQIPVELLINNAGYGDYKPVAGADPKVLSNK